jgi:hypothetical protein
LTPAGRGNASKRSRFSSMALDLEFDPRIVWFDEDAISLDGERSCHGRQRNSCGRSCDLRQ